MDKVATSLDRASALRLVNCLLNNVCPLASGTGFVRALGQ